MRTKQERAQIANDIETLQEMDDLRRSKRRIWFTGNGDMQVRLRSPEEIGEMLEVLRGYDRMREALREIASTAAKRGSTIAAIIRVAERALEPASVRQPDGEQVDPL